MQQSFDRGAIAPSRCPILPPGQAEAVVQARRSQGEAPADATPTCLSPSLPSRPVSAGQQVRRKAAPAGRAAAPVRAALLFRDSAAGGLLSRQSRRGRAGVPAVWRRNLGSSRAIAGGPTSKCRPCGLLQAADARRWQHRPPSASELDHGVALTAR